MADRDGRPRGTGGSFPLVWLVGIGLLAAAVRFWDFNAESIWLDEATSIRNATGGAAVTLRHRATTLHPPLYELLLGGWVAVAGDSETAVRGPSAVLGVLAVLAIARLGRELADRWVGLTAGLLAVASYLPLKFSREVRMYSMALALAAVSALLLWRALRSRRAAPWVALAAANVALAYTHVFGLLVLGVENVTFLCLWLRRRRGGRAWVAVQAATALALLPWVVLVLVPVTRNVAGRRGTYLTQPTLATAWYTLRCFLPLNPRQRFSETAAVAYHVVAALGLGWLLWRRPAADAGSDPRSSPGPASVGLFLALWLALPIAATMAMSRVLGPCYLHRCLIVAAPPSILLLALGIRALGKRLGTLAMLVVCILAVRGLRRFYREPLKEQWRQVVRHIQAERRAGDAVLICSGGCRKPFDYYCRVPEDVLPRHPVSRTRGAAELAAQLPKRLAGCRRAWLVLSHERNTPLREVLDEAPWATPRRRGPKALGITTALYELDLSTAADPDRRDARPTSATRRGGSARGSSPGPRRPSSPARSPCPRTAAVPSAPGSAPPVP